ncbi:calcium-binding protein [Microvirga sp. BT688]|uniref:calcium-binding protein n=1 Tax=Microvirga sp. TaxID=1873136 RepID=UPI001688CD7D|nr:calcium-binding protein [Microvirga sp.]MBD2746276.1 calcium-binding protein [Microvirga sp.]
MTWTSAGQDGSGAGVYQQLYAATGTKIGVETQVNTYTISDQSSPSVTAMSGGGWVVTWESLGQDSSSSRGVYQQLYAADGSKIGGEIRVNSHTAGDQHIKQVTAVGNGWVVTWRSEGQDGSGAGVYQRYYENIPALTAGTEYAAGTTVDDTFNVQAGGLTAEDTINGGTGVDTLRLSVSGALNIAAPAVFGGIEKLQGTAGADTITVSAARLANLTSIDGGPGADALLLASTGIYNLAAIQSLIGFETITGSGSADTILLTAAQFLSVATIQGQGGVDALNFASAGSYDLTALAGLSGIETIQGSSGNDTFVVSTARLAGVYALQGELGFDVLRMAASGTLDLSGLTSTTGFEAFEGTGASDTLILTGAQLSQFEQIKGMGGADTLQLASAGPLDISALETFSSFTTLKGSSGADTIRFRDIPMGNLHLDGGLGNDTFSLVAGGAYDLTTLASLTGIETIEGTDSNDVIVTNAARLGGLGVIDGGTGTGDVLELRADLYDLSALDILNVETIRLSGDADVTFHDKATALLARTTSVEASVTLNGATFTSAELGQLFRQGLRTITTISNDVTQSTAYVEPVIAGSLSNRTVEMTQTATPFASVDLDATPGLQVTATVTYDKDRGVLRDKDGAVHVTGTYAVTGTVAEVEMALRALGFDPTDRADVIGARQDTLFTLTLNDTVTTSQPARVTVTSTATNLKPGEPSLSRAAVQENAKAATVVGEVLVVDPNPQDGLTVSLTNNAGGSNSTAASSWWRRVRCSTSKKRASMTSPSRWPMQAGSRWRRRCASMWPMCSWSRSAAPPGATCSRAALARMR